MMMMMMEVLYVYIDRGYQIFIFFIIERKNGRKNEPQNWVICFFFIYSFNQTLFKILYETKKKTYWVAIHHIYLN